MHTPDATQQILSEMANKNLKNLKFWCMDKGMLPPVTLFSPYLGVNVRKKTNHLLIVLSIMHTFEASVWS